MKGDAEPLYKAVDHLHIKLLDARLLRGLEAKKSNDIELFLFMHTDARCGIRDLLRNAHPRDRSSTRRAFNMQKTVHRTCKPVDDRNAEPKPPRSPRQTGIRLIKAVGNVFQLVLVHADTGIRDLHYQVDAVFTLFCKNSDIHAAVFRKLEAVCDQMP